MVRVLALSVVDPGFKPNERLYKIGNPNVINEEDYTGRTITWTKTVRLLPLLL
jgi:hypothetical protein